MKIVKKIIVGTIVFAYLAFVILNTVLLLNINKFKVTQFGNTSVLPITNKVTSENFEKGDLVIVEKSDITQINIGDEIFVYKTQKTGAPQIDLGIVGEIHQDNDAISFENGATYSMDLVIGEAENVYPGVGSVFSIFQSTWGFFFLILVPSFLIFIYELYAIIVEVKLNKNN